jgi:hypothetical protein
MVVLLVNRAPGPEWMTARDSPFPRAYALAPRRTNFAPIWPDPARRLPLRNFGWQVAQKNVERWAWTIRSIGPPQVWQGVSAKP